MIEKKLTSRIDGRFFLILCFIYCLGGINKL